MYSKILGAALFLACSHAFPLGQHYHQATSFASFNDHHNTVHHIQSTPSLVKTAVALPVHASPVQVAPIAINTLISQTPAQSHSSVYIKQAAAPFAKLFTPVAASTDHEEGYGPAKYEFAYGVEDHHTGDIHSHKESRDGDFTQGEYSLHEADGTIRTVKYTVSKHSGFNAIVQRSGHAVHAQPVLHH